MNPVVLIVFIIVMALIPVLGSVLKKKRAGSEKYQQIMADFKQAVEAMLDADEQVEAICAEVSTDAAVVVPANYNCPGQLVISGHKEAIDAACVRLKEAGAKRALVLPVGGAFHSPLMQPAKEELEAAIAATEFRKPVCPVYQNVDGLPHTDPEEIKANLIQQLTASVLWTQEVGNMVQAGATEFTECGPGKALQGMIVKIAKGNEAVTVRGVAD